VAGFAVYLRLAQTRAVNSDAAAQALQAWDMLHGNLLLRGWTTSDVSFYTTELPQYLLIELVRGLGQDVAHLAAAMTYTLVVLLAALLAASRPAGSGPAPRAGGGAGAAADGGVGRRAGRDTIAAAVIAAGIMLAPPLGAVNVLLSSPDHLGTSVPLLASWLVLDRARPRWCVPLAACLLLAVAQVADSIVLLAGVIPLAAACALRIARPVSAAPRAAGAGARLRAGWYEAAVGAAALLSAGLADLVLRLVHAAGGFSVRPLAAQLAPAGEILTHNLPVAGQCLLLLAGADFSGPLGAVSTALAALHLAGAVLAAAGFACAVARLRRLDLVSQVLVAAIAVNLAAFAVTNRVYSVSSAREIAPVLPFAAALAARTLAGPLLRPAGAARQALRSALCLIGAGYLAGLGAELAAPSAPPQAAQLTAWLQRHQLGTGLSGYWEASVVTLTSGGQVAVRPVTATGGRVTPNAAEIRADWFSPARAAAHYVVFFPGIPGYPGFTGRHAVLATFGRPARSYRVGQYTVWYWPGNLLSALPVSAPARAVGRSR
jgi:hypothetical protein